MEKQKRGRLKLLNVLNHDALFPNNTQSVEMMVHVVFEAAPKSAGYDGRPRLILQTLESGKCVKIFNTKKQDADLI